jgi:hypothetical protein
MAVTLGPSIAVSPADPSGTPDWGRVWKNALVKPEVLATFLRGGRLISHGRYGAVYHVTGVAVKIGCIPEAESERQAWVHQQFKRALPVLAYATRVKLPDEIARRSCPIHGVLGDDEISWNCHCGGPMDLLVMPLAKPAPTLWFNRNVRGITREVTKALFERFQFFWEDKPGHVLQYQDRIVLADFGEGELDW